MDPNVMIYHPDPGHVITIRAFPASGRSPTGAPYDDMEGVLWDAKGKEVQRVELLAPPPAWIFFFHAPLDGDYTLGVVPKGGALKDAFTVVPIVVGNKGRQGISTTWPDHGTTVYANNFAPYGTTTHPNYGVRGTLIIMNAQGGSGYFQNYQTPGTISTGTWVIQFTSLTPGGPASLVVDDKDAGGTDSDGRRNLIVAPPP